MRVVVLLELVDIREQDGERTPLAPGALDLARERAHEMAAIVESRQGVGQGELLQLTLAFFLSQPRDHGIERTRQVPDFAAARRELGGEIAGRHTSGRFREKLERPGEQDRHHEREQADAQEQRDQEEEGLGAECAPLARPLAARRFGNRSPTQLGNASQHRHDFPSPGSRLRDGLAFALDEFPGRRVRQGGLHDICRVASRADDYAALFGDDVDAAGRLAGQLLQRIAHTVQIDLRSQCAEEQPVIAPDGDDQHDRRFVDTGIPERVAHQRVASSEVVEPVCRETEAGPAAGARQELPVGIHNREAFMSGEVLSD